MPRGQADFGMYAAKETIGSLADMAELAARLGSIVTLDRRGDVVFLDDFEAPILNWLPTGSGENKEQRLYTEKAYQGSQCVYLRPGDAEGNYSQISRKFHVTRNQRYGLEARFQHLYDNVYTTIDVTPYLGTHYYYGAWRYDSEENELLVRLGEDNWKVIATEVIAGEAFAEWYPSKLVVDSQTGKYVRGLFLGKEYDLSEEPMESTPLVVPVFALSTVIEVRNALGEECYALADNAIVTQNEP